jgi:hypothetical protein
VRFYRLNRRGQASTDTIYVRTDTVQPDGWGGRGPDMIHNAITFPKIDGREDGQPRSYLFDDWSLVMPID